MNQSYPIDPALARRVSADYLAIMRAGMLYELREEIRRTIEAHVGTLPDSHQPRYKLDEYFARRLDQWRDGGGRQLQAAREHAKDLAGLLDCPVNAVDEYIVPELLTGETTRTIVTDCIRNLANYARKQTAMAGRRAG